MLVLLGIIIFILIAYRVIKLVRILFMKQFWIGVGLQILFFTFVISYIVPKIDSSINNSDYVGFLVTFAIVSWITLASISRSFRLPFLFILGALTLGLVVFGIGNVDIDTDIDTDFDFDPDSVDFALEEDVFASEMMTSGADLSGIQDWAIASESTLLNATTSTMEFPSFSFPEVPLSEMDFGFEEEIYTDDSYNEAAATSYMQMNIPEDAVILDHDLDNDQQWDYLDNDMDNDGMYDPYDIDLDNDGMPDMYDSDLDNDGEYDGLDRDMDNDGQHDRFDRDFDNDGQMDYV
ncbi:hypothetical protein JMM81_19910 [Bacillus sp. V3B]|uniref:hypothetical protein n=1 Tax=Bacillus sp. V3B TaxID=2804915 RepID=UPI00210A2691|nr:hypothetical protein [Bacillus sp. V3B]MCQ6277144.1 hypothetical protein [Bacillus sp. V3B]